MARLNKFPIFKKILSPEIYVQPEFFFFTVAKVQ